MSSTESLFRSHNIMANQAANSAAHSALYLADQVRYNADPYGLDGIGPHVIHDTQPSAAVRPQGGGGRATPSPDTVQGVEDIVALLPGPDPREREYCPPGRAKQAFRV